MFEKIKVKTGFITGRNGTFALKEIEVGETTEGHFWLNGISKGRGACVNGGFFRIDRKAFLNLCRTVIKKQKGAKNA
jgi:hypothetical protein